MRKLAVLVTLIGALLGVAAGPAAASPTARVTLDVAENFEAGGGTFVADGGVVCPSGTTSNETVVTERGPLVTFDNHKTFSCADGSGTFTLRIFAWVRPCDTFDRGVWRVESGTGAYESLSGVGRLVGSYLPANACTATGIRDHLTGRMSLGG